MFWNFFRKTDKSDKFYGRVAIRFGTNFREYDAWVTSTGVVYVNHIVMDVLFVPTDTLRGVLDSAYGKIDYHWLDDPTKKENQNAS